MQENWKPEFTALILKELSSRTDQALKIASAAFYEEIESKRDALNESEFSLFVRSEPAKIKQSQSWVWFYLLISEYRTLTNLEKVLIGRVTAPLSEPPIDISKVVSRIERKRDHKLFLEGMKLQQKMALLRSAVPGISLRPYDPFADCLTNAIEHEKLRLGNTPAKIEFAERIAGMLEAQVNWRVGEYIKQVGARFERLNRENERLTYLESERATFQSSPAIAFFDKVLYHMDSAFDERHRVEIAIRTEIKPTSEILETWQNSHPKPEGLIQSIPFLKQMIEGWTEAKKFEFVEQELELRKAAMVETVSVPPQPVKEKVPEKKALPSLEDALKEPEKLPDLWAYLSEMDTAFVTENGNIIGGKKARKHREVMALAQLITPLMKEGFGQFEVYSMLCKRLVLTESKRA